MAEETHDSIDLLRSSISTSSPSVLLTAALEPSPSLSLASYISFPQPSPAAPINLTKDTPTRYTSKVASTDEFYTLAHLWLAWTEKDRGVRDYLVKGQAEGVGYVSVADRRGVVEFLQGDNNGTGRVLGKGQDKGELIEVKTSSLVNNEYGLAALAPSTTAASATVESLPSALDHEAGPSRTVAPAKRKYETDVADREFCKQVSFAVQIR